MKRYVIVLLLMLVTMGIAQWERELRCPVCIKKGYQTKLYEGGTTRTLMGVIPYYDEKGRYQYDDPNWSTTGYHCSSGHTFSIRSRGTNEIVIVTSSNDVVGGVGAYGVPLEFFSTNFIPFPTGMPK